MRKIYAAFLFVLISSAAIAQVSITTAGAAYTQDFNTLAFSLTSSVLPAGWAFAEAGSGANTTYVADNGAAVAGNTYSYGATSAAANDRAFGGVQSGSVIPVIGASFTNNTGVAVSSIIVAYTGEQWRLGATGRVDRLDFQYSTDATSLTTGTWTDADALDFIAPITTAAVGALNGNAAANRTAITSPITINIANGNVIWFRWNDFNASGADDGLAIDDFSATFNGSGTTLCTEPASQATGLSFNGITASAINGSFNAVSADGYLVVRSLSATLSASPADGTAYTTGSALGGGTIISTGTSLSFADNGLAAATTYYYFIFAYNNTACAGGPNYNIAAPLTGNAATSAPPACTTPPAPTGLNLTSANTSISGNFTTAVASNYLVIIGTSPSLSSGLVNGTVYSTGTVIGNCTVVSYGSTLSFIQGALAPATQYYFYVFAANTGCSGEPFYSVSPLTGNISTTNNSNGIPAGYYDAAAGLSCAALKNALSNIITNGQVPFTYGGIDGVQIPVADTLRSDDGLRSIIWDIYSNNAYGPEPFEFNASQNPSGGFCGSGGGNTEGSCWNKEHTFPRSWFKITAGSNGLYQQPTEADLYIVRPTDRTINGKRGNLPYSVVGGATTYSFPATATTYPGVPVLDKVGASTYAGVNGAAFEPGNGVKGDIARSYFYVVTRYQNNLSSWVGFNGNAPSLGTVQPIETVIDGNTGGGTYPSLQLSYLAMLYNWHLADPVDSREQNMNDLIYSQQNNRNPYIDHPEYAALVFQCTGVVPVTVFGLTAQKLNESTLLEWYATFEASFRQYDIERSIDGIHFNKIGETAGQNLANYFFHDNNLPKAAVVYYRLKMTDLNGSFRYSRIVSVKLDDNVAGAKVYPNPAADILHIRLSAAIQAGSSLQIIDPAGKIMKRQIISVSSSTIDVNLRSFSSGKYFVKLISNDQVLNASFVIAR